MLIIKVVYDFNAFQSYILSSQNFILIKIRYLDIIEGVPVLLTWSSFKESKVWELDNLLLASIRSCPCLIAITCSLAGIETPGTAFVLVGTHWWELLQVTISVCPQEFYKQRNRSNLWNNINANIFIRRSYYFLYHKKITLN